jgi:hypothetical protein
MPEPRLSVRWCLPFAVAAGVACLPALVSVEAADSSTCAIVDAYTSVTEVAAATANQPADTRLTAFKTDVIARYPGLYTHDVLGMSPGPEMDVQILHTLAATRTGLATADFILQLRRDIELTLTAFGSLPDFKCSFDIYLADTLGQMDGAGRLVSGRPALVIGVDALQKEQHSISLPVFFAHELFHRYHFQAAGFSDDLAERQPIWRALWAEGLASYASKVLTPGASESQALMLPSDLAERAQPLTPQLATVLLAANDRIDPQIFRTYFTYGRADVAKRGLPWRSGYFIGYLVAEKLADRFSLGQLAHMKSDEAHGLIVAQLRRLAQTGQ